MENTQNIFAKLLEDDFHAATFGKSVRDFMDENGMKFSDNTMKVFLERYANDGEKDPIDMYIRVAKALVETEPKSKRKDLFINYFNTMFHKRFIPAGRTLSNAGVRPIVSNCIVLHFDDTLSSIYETLKDAVLLQKWGSGLGFPFHLLRPAGYNTKNAKGVSSGPVSFLHVYDTSFAIIKQQGRHGANMGVMRIDHPDILEFISCKQREGDIKNFNISVAYTDEFMAKAIDPDYTEPWYCQWEGEKILPRRIIRDKNFSFVKAIPVMMTPREILYEISTLVHTNGEPGQLFVNRANIDNPLPHLGPLEATNPVCYLSIL